MKTTIYNRLANRNFPRTIWKCKSVKENTAKKIVHINGETAALFFYIKDRNGKLIPLTGTEYKPCGLFDFEKLPNVIKRHLNLNIMQDYIESKAIGNVSKYPFGLYFENGKLIEL